MPVEPGAGGVTIEVAPQSDKLVFDECVHWEQNEGTHCCRAVASGVALGDAPRPLSPPSPALRILGERSPAERFGSEAAQDREQEGLGLARAGPRGERDVLVAAEGCGESLLLVGEEAPRARDAVEHHLLDQLGKDR